MDRRLSPRYFDNDLPLVSTRQQMVDGHECLAGAVVPADLDHRIRLKLWMSGRAKYERDYSPVEIEQDSDGGDLTPSEVEIKETGSNGYYEVHAPWLEEPIRVRGIKKAEAKQAEILAAGPPAKDPEPGESEDEGGKPKDNETGGEGGEPKDPEAPAGDDGESEDGADEGGEPEQDAETGKE